MTQTLVAVQGLSDALALASSLVQSYKIACPSTTVVNRAQIVDPTRDLLPRQGLSRLMTLGLQEIQGEFGPAGQQVFKPINDTLDQVRFIGNWSSVNNANGQQASTGTVGDYVEVTFYGTGLNGLWFADASARDYRASTDGGSEGSNLFTATTSALNGRNYSSNVVTNIVSGLTLGTHTVKLRLASVDIKVFGFEVLTASGTSPNVLQLLPGVSLVAGKKLSKPALTVDSYNSNFESGALGTKGGHVVVYQKADGTVAKAVQPTDASQLNFSSASHTNETLIRTYNIREFGAGRSDDWSFANAGSFTTAQAFTLDDGVTSLVSTGGRYIATTLDGFQFQQSTAGKYIYFTFIGTGLDIMFTTDTSSRVTGLVSVDGTQISTGTTIAASTVQTIKIVSGLPYGTHTVGFKSDGSGLDSAVFSRFMIYGPLKPSIPAGAVEIADYYVMANFASNATPAAHIPSTGVLRKMPTRELLYTGSGWTPSLDTTQSSGFQAGTGGNGSTASLIFYGTAVEWRNHVINTGAHNVTLTVFSYATSANVSLTGISTFTTTATGGSSVYTASTGNVVVSGITGAGDEMVSINSLPLGLYKITVGYNSGASGAVYVDSFDVATPIHSPKSNLPGDIQTTVTVGNQAIGDSRIFPSLVVKSLSNWVQSIGVTSSPTTTSTSFVPMDLVCIVKTLGNPIEISYSINVDNSGAGQTTDFQVYVDGLPVGTPRRVQQPASSANFSTGISDNFIVPVGPGVHTVQLFWETSGGTATAEIQRRDLKARETT